MNKSVVECITRFAGKSESALPKLIQEIVGKIENELNESRVKRFIYDGENIAIICVELRTHSLTLLLTYLLTQSLI